MTIKNIEDILNKLDTCNSWSFQVLKITNNRHGTTYLSREVDISPSGRVTNHVLDLAQTYLNSKLNEYTECRKYDGSTDGKIIYKLMKNDPLISEKFDDLITAISNPDSENDVLSLKVQASVFKGTVEVEGEMLPVKLISMQNPITILQRKFMSIRGKFEEITDKVISLRNSIDVLILKDTVYMLNLAAENLFNLERAYKSVCLSKIEKIEEANIVSNISVFKRVASSGHNPRKFILFNENYLEKLKDENIIRIVATKFEIPLENSKFDTTEEEVSDKIVKILCQRGMLDPIEGVPMEVSGSKKWS